MPRTRSSAALAAAIALIVIGCTSCGGGNSKAGAAKRIDHPVTLHMAGLFLDQSFLYATAVDRLSHHTIRLRLVDPGPNAVHADARIVAAVRSGKFDVALVPVRVFDTLGDRAFQALATPLLIDSYALEGKVLASSFASEALASTRRLGVVGVALLPGPLRRMLGLTRSFAVPSDFHGAIVGHQASNLTEAALRALGATPRALPGTASLTGIDGYEQQLPSIVGNGYLRASRTRTVMVAPVLWPRAQVLIANPRVWAQLSSHQQAILRTAGPQTAAAQAEALRRDDATATRQLCSAGARLVAADAARFRAAFAPVYLALERDAATAERIREIEDLKRETSPEARPTCHADRTAAVPRRATPIDGVWRTERAHADVPENEGLFIRVFDRGRWALTQQSAGACTWGYGTYTVRGRRLETEATDGGGIAPNNATAKPGERIAFRWNIYRGRLSLPNAPDFHDSPVEPTPYELVSKTPSADYFSKRCPPPAKWNR
ncbi:MAG TPA: TRAP transporter substrate-binding protein DctP [Thermoleophilaceae bacterium]